MEHPLIGDLDDLTIEQLYTKITDLNKKLSWASRHNRYLASQIQMALESYQNKYREKQQKIWEAARQHGTDYSDRIDIS
jgi:hypothetical protein